MDSNIRIIDTIEDLKIFNNPFRMKIINVYKNHITPLTVKQCAEILEEVPSKVHYHVQKLLSINILVLDHIEIINGINAKYYMLPQKAFTIALKTKETEVLYSQNNEVDSLIDNIMSEFKTQLLRSKNKDLEFKNENNPNPGFISSNNIYLSEDDFEELSNLIQEIGNKFSKNEEGKKEYAILSGLARIK